MSKTNLSRKVSKDQRIKKVQEKKMLKRPESSFDFLTKTTSIKTSDKKLIRNIFSTSNRKEYEGPIISEKKVSSTKTPKAGIPFYFDSNGNTYDVYFQKIEGKYFRSSKLNFNKLKFPQLVEENLPKLNNAFPKFPKPDDFSDFSDFEQAVVDWRSQVDSYLGYTHLPNIIGRAYDRPRIDLKEKFNIQLHPVNKLDKVDEKFDENSDEIVDENSIKMKKSSLLHPNISLHSSINFKEKKTQIIIWDHQLILPEPDPMNYKTFEEFQFAFQRWSKITAKSLKIIPPHARQLASIHGLTTKAERQKKEQERKEIETGRLLREQLSQRKNLQIIPDIHNFKWISRIGSFLSLDSPIKLPQTPLNLTIPKLQNTEKKEIIIQEEIIKNQENNSEKISQLEMPILLHMDSNIDREEMENFSKIRNSSKWHSLPEETCKSIQAFISGVINIYEKNTQKYHQKNAPLMGILHGYFPQSTTFSNSFKENKQDDSFFNDSLRRSDISVFLIQKSIDCPSNIDGKTVSFQVPQYEPYHSFNLKDFQVSEIPHLIQQIIDIDKEYEFSQLLESNHPRFQKNDMTSIQLLFALGGTFKINDLLKALTADMYLDSFLHFLLTKIGFNNEMRIRVIESIITFNQFNEVLELFNVSRNFLFHAKLGSFIMLFLRFPRSVEFFKKYLGKFQGNLDNDDNDDDIDLYHLYYLAYAFNCSSNNSNFIFPCPHTFKEFHVIHINPAYISLEKSLFALYYLDIMDHSIPEKDRPLFEANYEIIQKKIHFLNLKIEKQITQDKGYFDYIFQCFTSRSFRLSTYYLFIFTQMLKLKTQITNDILQSDTVNLFQKLRETKRKGKQDPEYLSKTNTYNKTTKKIPNESIKETQDEEKTIFRFRHVYFAYIILWRRMQKSTTWNNFVMNKYSERINQLIVDLTPDIYSTRNSTENIHRGSKLPVFIREFYQNVLRSSSRMKAKSISVGIPGQLLELMKKLLEINSNSENLIEIAKIFLLSTKALIRVNSIAAEAKKQPKSNTANWIFSNLHIRTILFILTQKNPFLDEMKSHLISSLRHLIKNQQIFLLIHNYPNFYQEIQTLFSETKNEKLIHHLFHLFSDSIVQHPKSLKSFFGSSQQVLVNIVGMISSRNTTVSIHVLQFLTRIFNMILQADLSSKQKDPITVDGSNPKGVKKNLQSFVEFFIKGGFFVQIHRLNLYCLDKKDFGRSFIVLANFLHTLDQTNQIPKIMKELKGTQNYTKPLYQILKFFSQN
ncbi:sca1 complex scaffold protein scaa [Anaeramoeba ignava]|uniref:Sca1 complex scaffold protein scaa n=1 Tax=Anaeramoeba ignava TaxID=1746090 RepID=A0A9Q0RB20_ANAIG|nr:sca1 complex scaffold protein scaa [Anaeramoeba ignava]